MKIVADNKIPFLRGVLESLAGMLYLPGKDIFPEHVQDADALITRTRTECNAALLEASKIKIIASATIGYDHIDTEYCENKGVAWTNAPGCNSSSVQQYIASALLNLAADEGFDLTNKVLGVIGVGHVGTKVVKFGENIGMQVLLNDPPRADVEGNDAFVELEQIKEEADIITLHVPLEKDAEYPTYHLVDEKFLGDIRRDCWLINSSRGAVVDKKIAGAVLDVWEDEPDLNLDLLKLVKLATPHIAGYSADGKANGTAMSVQAISRHFDLGLDDWYPPEVPVPENQQLKIDAGGKTDQEILREAVNASYDIREDDRRLRNSPATFEQQRGDYPLRREFPVFTVKLENPNPETQSILSKTGFKVATN